MENKKPTPQETLGIMAEELTAIHEDTTKIANRLGIIVLPFWLWLIATIIGAVLGFLYLLAETLLR